jgi:two-component system chemotaxis response regulator CheY
MIILIDDNPIDTFIHTKALELGGYRGRIEAFHSAEKALEYFKGISTSAIEPDSFVLLDIRIPAMNGFEFLDALKRLDREVIATFPVYFLSSSLDLEDLQRANTYSNVVGFLEKPLTRHMVAELPGIHKVAS